MGLKISVIFLSHHDLSSNDAKEGIHFVLDAAFQDCYVEVFLAEHVDDVIWRRQWGQYVRAHAFTIRQRVVTLTL